jgi:general secretion pathway protein D
MTLIFSSGYVSAQKQQEGSSQTPYRVFYLKNISAVEGKKYLDDAQIGTVSRLPDSDIILVTAQPYELIKATAIIQLVDTAQRFSIKRICSASEARGLPSNNNIEKEIDDISIGTFSDPPVDTASVKVIIDIHNDSVVAVVPEEYFGKITQTIKYLQKKGSEKISREVIALEKEGEPEQLKKAEGKLDQEEPIRVVKVDKKLADTESDELFDKLLTSLEKAQKTAEQKWIEAEIKKRTEKPDSKEAEVKVEPDLPDATKEKAAVYEKKREEPVSRTEAEGGIPKVDTQKPAKEDIQADTSTSDLYKPAAVELAEEELELNLPEKLQIVDLIDLVGKYMQLDYMYDPVEVIGEVTLRIQGPIKVKELYPLLERALKFRGFVMSRKGNFVTIVKTDKMLEIDPALLKAEDGKIQYGDVIVTRVFRLKYIDTDTAESFLTGMKLGMGITKIPETGTLFVTGYTYRMSRIEELLQLIDVPGKRRSFRHRQLKYTMAVTTAEKVKALSEQLGTVSITVSAITAQPSTPSRSVRGRPPARPVPQRPTKPSAAPAAGGPTVYIDADERTNRILMIGYDEQLEVVESLIDAIDVEKQDLRTLRVYEIKHVDAEDMLEKLGTLGLVDGGGRSRASASRPQRISTVGKRSTGQRPGTPTTAMSTEGITNLGGEPQVIIIESTNSLLVNATEEQHIEIARIIGYVDNETLAKTIPYKFYPLENQEPDQVAGVLNELIKETVKDKEGKIEKVVTKEEDIVIVPDPNTFSLIVYASKKNQEWIASLIEKLDRRRPQVLIDVTLVEISREDAFTYDLDLVTKYPTLAAEGGMDKLSSIVTPFLDRRTWEAFSTKGFDEKGGGSFFYSDEHIQMLLELMEKKKYGRVLAKPKILANDNEEGHIQTEFTTYISRTSSTAGTGDNPLVAESVEFEEFKSGIELTITPHISAGDLLRLKIDMIHSNQDSASELGADSAPPDKTENTIGTIVTVPDNRTIILGGIVTLNQTKLGKKVPIIGDIPIVGGLFRNIDNSDEETKLYIFVKAYISRPLDNIRGLPQLEKISEYQRAQFEKAEEKFQKYEQWPGIKPEPMDPLKVLDE